MAYKGKRRQQKRTIPWLTGGLTFGLLLVVSVTAYNAFSAPHNRASVKPTGKQAQAPAATTTTTPPPEALCPLTGLPMGRAASRALPMAVVIENHPKARPQSGLGAASLVYEVVAEGGITRFLATFHHAESSVVGPVRSVREYLADLSHSQGAVIVHCGGSPTGYAAVRRLGVPELDQFANGGSFWRARDRRAPHNLYTSTGNLKKRAKELRFSGASPEPLSFKDDLPQAERPAQAWVDIDFSTAPFRVRWDYDAALNSYARLVGGRPHVDAVARKQITAKNVVLIFTAIRLLDNVGRVRVDLSSAGRALVFRDGGNTEARWVRPASGRMIDIRDPLGQAARLNRGNTWFEIVALGRPVTWGPSPEATPGRTSSGSQGAGASPGVGTTSQNRGGPTSTGNQ